MKNLCFAYCMVLLSCENVGQSPYTDTTTVESTTANVLDAKTHEPTLVKLVANQIDFGILTFSNINCDSFGSRFSYPDAIVITDKNKLAAINYRIKELKSEEPYAFDVRAKARLYYSDNSGSVLCIDRFSMELNGKRVKYDSTLVEMIGINTE